MKKTKGLGSLQAFTLIEVLGTISIMSVFTVIALTSLGGVVDDARFSQTTREMEIIRNVLVGETQRLETGLRKNYGYLGDMGGLPTTLANLSSLPAGASSWSINSTLGIGMGWNGPYLSNTFDQDFFKDAWGNNYVYSYSAGGTSTLTSYGADGVAGNVGGGAFDVDIVLNMPLQVVKGNLYGYVVNPSGDLLGADQTPYLGAAEVYVYYPNGSGVMTSSVATVSAGTSADAWVGKYTFTNLPLGYAAVKVFMPSFATPTSTLGPSIVEINKAAAATAPVANNGTSVFGTTSACAANEAFTATNFSSDTAALTVRVDVTFVSDFTWSGTFDHERGNNAGIQYMTISNTSGTTSYRLYSGTQVSAAGTADIANNSSFSMVYTMSPILLSAAIPHRITYKYTAMTGAAGEIYYQQLGCKFLRLYPGMPL